MAVTIVGNNTPTAGGVVYGDGTNYASTSAGSAGGVLYSAGSSAPAFTAAGTSGQVLTSAGSGAPTWANPSISAMTLISTKTASSSATIEWTGLSGYNKYLLCLQGVFPDADAAMCMQIGYGSTTYITSLYSDAGFYANTYTTNGATLGYAQISGNIVVKNSDYFDRKAGVNGTILLQGLLTTRPAFAINVGFVNSAGNLAYVANNGVVPTSSNITAIKIYFGSGNVASGKLSLYGLSS